MVRLDYERMKSRRLELDLTQKELAEMTGTTVGCVYSSIAHGHKGWDRVEVEDEDAEMCEMR